jgi:hypothetical protein
MKGISHKDSQEAAMINKVPINQATSIHQATLHNKNNHQK